MRATCALQRWTAPCQSSSSAASRQSRRYRSRSLPQFGNAGVLLDRRNDGLSIAVSTCVCPAMRAVLRRSRATRVHPKAAPGCCPAPRPDGIPRLVHHLERTQQTVEQAAQPALIRRDAHRLSHLPERHALVVRHHHVGRAIGFPEAMHLHQRRVSKRARSRASLTNEVSPAAKVLANEGCVPALDHRAARRQETGKYSFSATTRPSDSSCAR